MTETDPLDERVWELGWEHHSRLQRRRLARLSLAEKLAWLEDAHRLVQQLARTRPSPEGGVNRAADPNDS